MPTRGGSYCVCHSSTLRTQINARRLHALEVSEDLVFDTLFTADRGGGGAPVGEHEVRARLRLEGLFVLASLAATDCVCDATASPNPPERLCSFLGLLTPPRHAPRVGKARVGAGVVMSQRASMTGGLTRMRRMARMVQKVQNLVFCSLVLRTYHTLSGPRPLPPPTRPL